MSVTWDMASAALNNGGGPVASSLRQRQEAASIMRSSYTSALLGDAAPAAKESNSKKSNANKDHLEDDELSMNGDMDEDDENNNKNKEAKFEEEIKRVPDDYYRHATPKQVIPQELHIQKLVDLNPDASLQELLKAADADFQLHLARVNHVLTTSSKSKNTSDEQGNIPEEFDMNNWNYEKDIAIMERNTRNKARHESIQVLKTQTTKIMEQLHSTTSTSSNIRGNNRAADIQRDRLQKWQRAMDVYVYTTQANAPNTSSAPNKKRLDLLQLVDKLCEGCNEEEELLEALSQAVASTSTLVESTSMAVKDALQDAVEEASHYRLRMEAHSLYAKRRFMEAQKMDRRYRSNGKMAMKIGQQLELAEAKLCQYEKASVILRALWVMEQLALEEERSGDEIQVFEEVGGKIDPDSCKLPVLYTAPENCLEAAKALQALRSVLKSRGVQTSASSGMLDPSSIRRFEITSKLIYKVSDAVENQLLSSFVDIYQASGTYDFSDENNSGRNGNIEWVTLRELTEALLYFDNGRNLFHKYVNLVMVTRFPELFDDDHWFSDDEEEEDDEQEQEAREMDLDMTRSKLTTLCRRVAEVCAEEFEFIAHVFDTPYNAKISSSSEESVQLQVARLLLQRIISHNRTGLQARINDLLLNVDRRNDLDSGMKKLDTIVVIHEKAAGLFILLKDAAETKLFPAPSATTNVTVSTGGPSDNNKSDANAAKAAATRPTSTKSIQILKKKNEVALASLVNFLNMEQNELSEGHRREYLTLEMRLLHHECCVNLIGNAGLELLAPIPSSEFDNGTKQNATVRNMPIITSHTDGNNHAPEYHAPIVPADTDSMKKGGFNFLLDGPLKQFVWRKPLTLATDSLARARLMFGGFADPESTARVVLSIYNQMCNFYGQSYLFPIMTVLGELVSSNTPSSHAPSLPFNEDLPAHDLGVDGRFWRAIEQVQSAAKAFDREIWGYSDTNKQRVRGNCRVWELLVDTGSHTSLTLAKDRRQRFYREVESRGEATIMSALETISKYMYWILVIGGESMLATGANWLLSNLQQTQAGFAKAGVNQGPYAVPTGSHLEAQNSPAVKSLTFCLRAQFQNIQGCLPPPALSSFWSALSMRLHDILCARLLNCYYVSTVGAVILSRDVEALIAASMLAGSDHSHWDILRELLTLYMTPPDALKVILVGAEDGSSKGLFARAGQDRSLYFMSRRIDFRQKTNAGMRKSQWAVELLYELSVEDPSENGPIDPSLYTASRF